MAASYTEVGTGAWEKRRVNPLKKFRDKVAEEKLTESILWRVNKIVFERLDKINLQVKPFYLHEEGLLGAAWEGRKDGYENYETGFLGKEDMSEIAAIPRGEWSNEEKLLSRLRDGQQCLGAKYQGKIVAFTWCNLASCHDSTYRFPLKGNEAYLWDAYTLPTFRGKGLAPFARYELYKALKKMSRYRFYSITEFTNGKAIKFKSKLKAKPIMLGINFSVNNKSYFSIKIKSYNPPSYIKDRLRTINLS